MYIKEKIFKNLFGVMVVILGILITSICIYAGNRSAGLEGDEVFSYISATSNGGFKKVCFLEDQTLYEGQYFYNSLSATEEERFNIPMVVKNQEMDTHPPLFYILLNFVCSFFPGVYSRWFGIGLNIILLFAVWVGLFLLLDLFLKNKYMALILSAIFCCSRLSVSMVLFIRMYVLLMACFLFQSWYHLVLLKRSETQTDMFCAKNVWKQYLLLAFITLAGALTHYYFLVYQLMISMLYIVVLLKKKEKKQIIYYIVTMAISGISYCIMYPAVFEHILFKYRGRESVHKFLKQTTLFKDGMAMFEIFNEYLYHRALIPILSILLILTVLLIVRKKISWKMVVGHFMLIMPSIVYFWGISKAAPYISLRYVAPVAALIFTFVVIWMKMIWNQFSDSRKNSFIICIVFFVMCMFYPIQSTKSSYYDEKIEVIETLAEYNEYCIYITGDEYNWKMWEDYINYPKFKGVFFIDGVKKQKIENQNIIEQKELVVFVDKALDLSEMESYWSESLLNMNSELIYETSYIYIVQLSKNE